MTLELKYEQDYQRVMSAVINDSRGSILALKGATGMQIYAYIQSQTALVTSGVAVYRIVALGGVLAGFVGINTNAGTVGIKVMQIRPAFLPDTLEINQFISTFISTNQFLQDVIY